MLSDRDQALEAEQKKGVQVSILDLNREIGCSAAADRLIPPPAPDIIEVQTGAARVRKTLCDAAKLSLRAPLEDQDVAIRTMTLDVIGNLRSVGDSNCLI